MERVASRNQSHAAITVRSSPSGWTLTIQYKAATTERKGKETTNSIMWSQLGAFAQIRQISMVPWRNHLTILVYKATQKGLVDHHECNNAVNEPVQECGATNQAAPAPAPAVASPECQLPRTGHQVHTASQSGVAPGTSG